MGRYVYLCFVKWLESAHEKGYEFFAGTWLPRHEELCRENGVELLRWGLPWGTAEDHVFIYETDMAVAEFQDFKGEVSRIDGERLWDYSRTIVVNCPE